MSFSTHARFALAAACAALMAPAAFAQAIPVKLTQGEAQLPTSGLVIDLPAKAGIQYDVSGSWALSGGGASFDARDIVDEIEIATGKVATGNWVLSGYFTAGGCSETLADAKLDAIGELIEFKTGKEILDAATQVQAEQKVVGEILGRVLKK